MKAIFGILIIFLFVSLACSSSTPTQVPAINQAANPVPTEIPTNPPPPSSTLDPLAELKQLVADALGTSNRDAQRLSDFSFDPSTSEISVTFAANDNLTENMIKRGIQMDIVEILKTIYQSKTSIPYNSIFIMATFPLVDTYGNTNETNVVLATYDRSNLDKVNWDNFLTDNAYVIANQDTLYIHPALQP